MSSMVYQVDETYRWIFTPEVSRHELKQQGLAGRRITSISTFKAYRKIGIQLALQYQEKYGIKKINEITSAMAQEFVQGFRDRESSGGHVGKVEAAIRKLDAGMKERGWRKKDAEPLLPESGGWHSDARPERAYSPRDAEQIIGDMGERARDKQTADVAKLQRVAGLRIKEAVMVRGQDIDVATCTIQVVRGTKGGRPRVVNVDPRHRDFLRKLKARADGHRDGCVFQGRGHRGMSLSKRTREAVRQACNRLGVENYGTHGFCKCWAQEQHRELCDEGLDDCNARREVAKGLGHNRYTVTYAYIPRED